MDGGVNRGSMMHFDFGNLITLGIATLIGIPAGIIWLITILTIATKDDIQERKSKIRMYNSIFLPLIFVPVASIFGMAVAEIFKNYIPWDYLNGGRYLLIWAIWVFMILTWVIFRRVFQKHHNDDVHVNQ